MEPQIVRHPTRRGAWRLTLEQWLPAPRIEVFEFFADANNLEAITPRWLNFRVLTARPIAMHAGTIIEYRLKLHGIPLFWRTEIAEWSPPVQFIDCQLRGPYRLWQHLHTFEERDGGTFCRDQVDYAFLGGELIHNWLVRPDLKRIFEFRYQQLAMQFPSIRDSRSPDR